MAGLTPTELATAAEQAGPEQQRELLEAAFDVLFPNPMPSEETAIMSIANTGEE